MVDLSADLLVVESVDRSAAVSVDHLVQLLADWSAAALAVWLALL